MILLDDRVGAIELLPYFRPYGISVEPTRLEAADAAFVGYGPTGDCMIGIERKRTSDLIQSMRDHRLSGSQVPKLQDSYQYVFLQVEGVFRPGSSGLLEEYQGKQWHPSRTRVMYSEVDNYLNSLSLRAGCDIKRSGGPMESVAQIVNLYNSFQKPWASHTSHIQIYAPGYAPRKVRFTRDKISDREKLCRDVAIQLPGIDTKCEDVAKYFGSTRGMVMSGVEQWERIKGIGPKMAHKIVHLIG